MSDSNGNGHGRTEHVEGCQCVRCRGFQPANELALRHGAYAVVRLTPRAAEIAEQLRAVAPVDTPTDAPAFQLAAMALARVEAAELELERCPLSERLSLSNDARRWSHQARLWLVELGLTPLARARLGWTMASATNAAVDLEIRRLAGEIAVGTGQSVDEVIADLEREAREAEQRRSEAKVSGAAAALRERLAKHEEAVARFDGSVGRGVLPAGSLEKEPDRLDRAVAGLAASVSEAAASEPAGPCSECGGVAGFHFESCSTGGDSVEAET